MHDFALFNLAIDSKPRDCDVVAVRVEDVAPNGYTLDRATVRQRTAGRPVRSEVADLEELFGTKWTFAERKLVEVRGESSNRNPRAELAGGGAQARMVGPAAITLMI